MAWNKDMNELYDALRWDIDGWDTISPPVVDALLAWILEDRTHSANTKAERLIARRRAS